MRVYSLGARSVVGDLAVVDVQDLAGNERRRLEEDDGVDDVADLAHVIPGETALTRMPRQRRLATRRRLRPRPEAGEWL
jgi:hypothetical protein